MKVQRLMEKIQLSAKAVELYNDFEMSEKEYLKWKELFETDVKKFLEKGNEIENFEKILLCFYIRFAADKWEWYMQEGISEEIYIQTMKDISIWEKDYEKRNQQAGIKPTEWISFSLQGKLFRLGRLQFEPIILEKTVVAGEKTYQQGTKVLNVHIPEDGRLSKEDCESSFEKAEGFFKSRGFKEKNVYVCESWLLSPVLKRFLKEDSNILDFQRRFCTYDVINSFRQAEERIFGEIKENIEDYQESTSLQKAFKQWLRTHPENIGMGVGIFCYKDELQK